MRVVTHADFAGNNPLTFPQRPRLALRRLRARKTRASCVTPPSYLEATARRFSDVWIPMMTSRDLPAKTHCFEETPIRPMIAVHGHLSETCFGRSDRRELPNTKAHRTGQPSERTGSLKAAAAAGGASVPGRCLSTVIIKPTQGLAGGRVAVFILGGFFGVQESGPGDETRIPPFRRREPLGPLDNDPVVRTNSPC